MEYADFKQVSLRSLLFLIPSLIFMSFFIKHAGWNEENSLSLLACISLCLKDWVYYFHSNISKLSSLKNDYSIIIEKSGTATINLDGKKRILTKKQYEITKTDSSLMIKTKSPYSLRHRLVNFPIPQ